MDDKTKGHTCCTRGRWPGIQPIFGGLWAFEGINRARIYMILCRYYDRLLSALLTHIFPDDIYCISPLLRGPSNV
jgi:hypothetical protein